MICDLDGDTFINKHADNENTKMQYINEFIFSVWN